MAVKTVAIIILNYNGNSDTLECLKSLSKLDKPSFKLQIIIVDYGSLKLEPKLKTDEKSKVFLIRKETNLGFAKGNNIGIKKALDLQADYILLLNNDTLVSIQFLNKLFDYLEKNPQVGLVSPKIYFAKGYEYHKKRYDPRDLGKVIWYGGGKIDWNNMYCSHKLVDKVDKNIDQEISDTDFISGCCVLVKSEIFKKIGFLNEKYFMYWEDVDFSTRLKKAGWQVKYYPDAYVWHKNAGSSGVASNLQDYFLNRNRLYFGFKYASIRTRLALLRQSLVKLIKGNFWERKAVQDFYLKKMEIGSWGK